jgi:hypothetical protein
MIEFEDSGPQMASTAETVLAGAVEGWRTAEIKATIKIGKINVQLDTKFFFPMEGWQ